jgi:hypothetical protein
MAPSASLYATAGANRDAVGQPDRAREPIAGCPVSLIASFLLGRWVQMRWSVVLARAGI